MLFEFSLARGHFSQGRRPGVENRPLVRRRNPSPGLASLPGTSPQTSQDFSYGVMRSGWSMVHFTQRGARPHMLAHL